MSTDQATLFGIEDVLRLEGKQIQKGIKYFDIGIKLEKLLYDLHSLLYWSSLLEAFSLLVAIILMFKFIN